MKRCSICGNLSADDSTVCKECGNPYLEPAEEAAALEEGLPQEEKGNEVGYGIEEVQPEPAILKSKAVSPEIAVARRAAQQPGASVSERRRQRPEAAGVQRRTESMQLEGTEKKEGVGETLPKSGASAVTTPEMEEAVEREEQTGGGAERPVRENRTSGQRSAGTRYPRSGPHIYGQSEGTLPQNEGSGMLRREINGADGGARPARRQGNPSGRPANSRPVPQGQAGRRPVNGQGYPEGRPAAAPRSGARQANPSGAAPAQRVPARQGNTPQGRPAARPVYPQAGEGRPVGYLAGRVMAASRAKLRSLLFLLIAVLQTVSLIGSVAAIFLKELNFSQIMRVVTSVPLPSQLTGYTEDLLKLMAKLDTDAIAVNLLLRFPDLLLCIGLWMVVAAVRTKSEEMSGAGFGFMKAFVIIGLIKNGLLAMVGLVISVALVVSAWAAGERTMIVASVATLVIMIVLTMAIIMYYFCYLATITAIARNSTEGEEYGAVSVYAVAVIILNGLFAILGLLSGIVNVEISGIVGSAAKIGWMLLFALWLLMYRAKLAELMD